ncbi:MAG: response regulator transcription factor [Bryobacteraceae bacterium]|nr:response regulator transcription factor [Bryobacteraceae bacterium]
MSVTIQVIDADAGVRQILSTLLEREGYRTILHGNPEAALKAALSGKTDLILVDVQFPGVSSFEICKQVRNAKVNTPIIVLSSAGEELDKVLLLEIGADDYIVKPFGPRELLARIRAILRRSAPAAKQVISFGDIRVDLERRVVTKRETEVRLTPSEYSLLTYFAQNPDRPLTRDAILNSVWGTKSFPGTRTVDAHVVRLRQKLEAQPDTPRHFLTMHGFGYRFLP